jgi:hypothetical protein
MERFYSSFFRLEQFYSMFGKHNRTVSFFWLKSIIERIHSVLCLLGEPYKCRVKERNESARVRENVF